MNLWKCPEKIKGKEYKRRKERQREKMGAHHWHSFLFSFFFGKSLLFLLAAFMPHKLHMIKWWMEWLLKEMHIVITNISLSWNYQPMQKFDVHYVIGNQTLTRFMDEEMSPSWREPSRSRSTQKHVCKAHPQPYLGVRYCSDRPLAETCSSGHASFGHAMDFC